MRVPNIKKWPFEEGGVSTVSEVPCSRYQLSLALDDFDAFTAAARQWDLDFRQLDRGGFRAEMLIYGGGPVQLGRARFSRALLQHGAPPRGHRTFVVPVDSSMHMNWLGRDVSGAEVLAFPLNGELHSISTSDFHIFTIAVREEYLAGLAEAMKLPTPSELIGRREAALVPPQDLDQLRRLLRVIACGLEGGDAPFVSGPEAPGLRAMIEVELPRRLLRVFSSGDAERSGKAAPTHLASPLVRAERFALANVHRAPGVKELCTAVGRSDRTVRRLFLERYGMGPKQYLQALRLNAVRRALRDADPATDLISEIAMHHGFWHMGQFSADYRRQFGDLPSATLGGGRGRPPLGLRDE